MPKKSGDNFDFKWQKSFPRKPKGIEGFPKIKGIEGFDCDPAKPRKIEIIEEIKPEQLEP
jgi:hypothetical protein